MEELIIEIFKSAILNILILALPMLLAALLVGLIISIFQATTQIQEQTLAFVPKIIAIFLVILIAGPWLLKTIVDFAYYVFSQISVIIS